MPPGAPTLPRSGANVVDGEFAFTEADFRRISAMVHGDAGIYLPQSKATLVYSRLAKRLRALGLTSFKAYCALVASVDGLDERQKMLAALTTNVTRFFREPHHFEHLRHKVLPPLLEQARRGGRVRIWSAACSSGQEAFSIAMTVLSAMPEAAERDIRILATDIDPNMVAEGRGGTYAAHLLEGVPPELRKRWTLPAPGGAVRMADEARSLVTFNELNLIGDWPMKGRFDAIFCRNVAIYFEDETQARLWSRFAPLLNPNGALYIGHSERVQGPAAGAFRPDGVTTYRKVAGAAA
jgi:chemotaxis protein methyltransferase CheR